MSIAPEIEVHYSAMNPSQRAVVSHSDGPLLVIAGPGSRKTFSLVPRALNLLLLGKAAPKELVLCTFAEKAAHEIRDRLVGAAAEVGYAGDLSELRVGTIHGICNGVLNDFRHRTPLGNAYETLDDLTELLFLFDHFDEVAGEKVGDLYLGRWRYKWAAIRGMRDYFDKITEELVDPRRLLADEGPLLRALGEAYLRYEAALFAENRVDFAHQQKLVWELLEDEEVRERVTGGIRYVMVDKYQDTNYVHEQVLLGLASGTENLCVVVDEDQSLYRFRGATVRNILEFPERFPSCETVKLVTNYRSHEKIVTAYDRWMASADWSNPGRRPFRYEKTIEPDAETDHADYPAIFRIWGEDEKDEAARFADQAAYLKDTGVIGDYSQVALLLRSVRAEHSGPYIEALAKKGIPAFCPRARAYFDNEEIRLMVGAFAVEPGDGRGGPGRARAPARCGRGAGDRTEAVVA